MTKYINSNTPAPTIQNERIKCIRIQSTTTYEPKNTRTETKRTSLTNMIGFEEEIHDITSVAADGANAAVAGNDISKGGKYVYMLP